MAALSSGANDLRVNSMRRLPDLEPGQIFDWLTFKDEISLGVTATGYKFRRGVFQCRCGEIVEKAINDVRSGRQKSCGCLAKKYRKGNVKGRGIVDLTGQRFGELVVERMASGGVIGGKRQRTKAVCLCDCGNRVEIPSVYLGKDKDAKRGSWRNCRDHSRHPDGVGVWYPPTPNPYPQEAAEIMQRYLQCCQPSRSAYAKFNSADIEDERTSRLIRHSWILAHRKQQGENITHEYERNYLWKVLRTARDAVKTKTAIIDRTTIGGRTAMNELTTLAVIETLPDIILSVPKKAKQKVKRC